MILQRIFSFQYQKEQTGWSARKTKTKAICWNSLKQITLWRTHFIVVWVMIYLECSIPIVFNKSVWFEMRRILKHIGIVHEFSQIGHKWLPFSQFVPFNLNVYCCCMNQASWCNTRQPLYFLNRCHTVCQLRRIILAWKFICDGNYNKCIAND